MNDSLQSDRYESLIGNMNRDEIAREIEYWEDMARKCHVPTYKKVYLERAHIALKQKRDNLSQQPREKQMAKNAQAQEFIKGIKEIEEDIPEIVEALKKLVGPYFDLIFNNEAMSGLMVQHQRLEIAKELCRSGMQDPEAVTSLTNRIVDGLNPNK